MASKPTEMCVVEKSGAREYKVLLLLLFSFLFFLLRLFLASVSFFHHLIIACCDYSFFSLSLSLSLSAVTRSGGSPSLVVDVWRWKGGGRTSRAVLFSRPVEFRRRRLFVSSQKLGAKRRAPLLETIGLMRKSVVRHHTAPPKSRAIQSRRSRRARTRWNHLRATFAWEMDVFARIDRDFRDAPRSWMGRRRRSVDEASRVQSRRSLFFFPFFYLS